MHFLETILYFGSYFTELPSQESWYSNIQPFLFKQELGAEQARSHYLHKMTRLIDTYMRKHFNVLISETTHNPKFRFSCCGAIQSAIWRHIKTRSDYRPFVRGIHMSNYIQVSSVWWRRVALEILVADQVFQCYIWNCFSSTKISNATRRHQTIGSGICSC